MYETKIYKSKNENLWLKISLLTFEVHFCLLRMFAFNNPITDLVSSDPGADYPVMDPTTEIKPDPLFNKTEFGSGSDIEIR